MKVGQLCVKTAGRDSGKQCVVVEILDKNLVLIDGVTRRRKCNMRHLEPLGKELKIKSGASHAEVSRAFADAGIKISEKEVVEKKVEKKEESKTVKKVKDGKGRK